MLRLELLLCTAVLVLLLAACASSPRVNVERHPSFDFAGSRSFAFLPSSGRAPSNQLSEVERLLGRMQEAASARLNGLGLKRVSIAEADLALVIHGESIPRRGVEQWVVKNPATNPRGPDWTASAYLEVDAIRYDERALRLEVYDTRNHQLVWVGWSRSTHRAPWPEEEIAAKVDAILKAFPHSSAPRRTR